MTTIPGMSRRLRLCGASPLLLLLLFLTPAAAEDDPIVIVEQFQASLLAVMREASTLGVKGRYERMLPPIERAFDLGAMTRIAIGEHWTRADESQRTRLVRAFGRMSASTVAILFDGYSGERFKTLGERAGQNETRYVNTIIVLSDGDVSLTYVAKRIGNGWKLIDVIVDDGISELTVRKSEYRRVLASDGVEGLIAALESKAGELIAQ
jgi:phospholipid transport system substrate-binding protein